MTFDSAGRFSNRVENYSKFRPHYPREIIDMFRREINLRASHRVADIGSGTGISSKLFLDYGCPVYAIEPNVSMRQAAENSLAAYRKFHSIDGTAEKTGLGDKSVEMITAYQAFQWFDNAKTRDEFRRILTPDGFVSLIWNERLLEANSFLREYEQLLIDFGTDYNQVRHDRINRESIETSFGKPFGYRTFDNIQTLDFEGFMGRTLSASYIPAESDLEFPDLLKNVRSLFARYEEKGKIQVLYLTKVYYGMI